MNSDRLRDSRPTRDILTQQGLELTDRLLLAGLTGGAGGLGRADHLQPLLLCLGVQGWSEAGREAGQDRLETAGLDTGVQTRLSEKIPVKREESETS